MQNPHLHDIVNIFLKFQSSIRIHYKVTGLQSLAKLYRTRFLLKKRTLQCVTKIILTAKLFGVGSSNCGFVHLDNWATHLKNLNKIRRRSAWGFMKICSFDVEIGMTLHYNKYFEIVFAMLDMSLLLVFFHAGNKLWTAGIYLVAQNKKTQKLKTN